MATDGPGHALLAVTVRNGVEESYHWGSVVALGPTGEIELAVGNPSLEVFGRSSNKPLQAVAMVRAGLQLSPELLALVCASHSGTPAHLAGVREILSGCSLGPEALANTADYPLDSASRREVIRAGGEPTAMQMNCSGKHSGMLATCVGNGWATDAGYLNPDHPLQRRITETIDELTEHEHSAIGVDGCGAPAHVTGLVGLARAFRRIALSAESAGSLGSSRSSRSSGSSGSSGEAQVYRAMTEHPFNVGGPGRDVTRFMEAIPGLMAKDGAEGVYAAALPDGRAVALKIADGADRPRPAVMAAALSALGVDVSPAADAWHVEIKGHGQRVGVVKPLGDLARWLTI